VVSQHIKRGLCTLKETCASPKEIKKLSLNTLLTYLRCLSTTRTITSGVFEHELWLHVMQLHNRQHGKKKRLVRSPKKRPISKKKSCKHQIARAVAARDAAAQQNICQKRPVHIPKRDLKETYIYIQKKAVNIKYKEFYTINVT